MFDEKEQHAQEFTDIERQTLRVWFDVDSAGNDALADAVLNAGLQLEHYTSLLADDADKRTPGQLARQQLLAFRLSEQLSLAADFLKSKGNGDAKLRIHQFRQQLAPMVTEHRQRGEPDA